MSSGMARYGTILYRTGTVPCMYFNSCFDVWICLSEYCNFFPWFALPLQLCRTVRYRTYVTSFLNIYEYGTGKVPVLSVLIR